MLLCVYMICQFVALLNVLFWLNVLASFLSSRNLFSALVVLVYPCILLVLVISMFV
jgi:hypothetical protein